MKQRKKTPLQMSDSEFEVWLLHSNSTHQVEEETWVDRWMGELLVVSIITLAVVLGLVFFNVDLFRWFTCDFMGDWRPCPS